MQKTAFDFVICFFTIHMALQDSVHNAVQAKTHLMYFFLGLLVTIMKIMGLLVSYLEIMLP